MIAATEAFTALGHPGRLAVFRLLARRAPDGVRPGEIAMALGVKPNTLSVHIGALQRVGLVTAERQGKSILYRIDFARTGSLVDFLISDCCRGRPELCTSLGPAILKPDLFGADSMTADTATRPFNVLFVCTGNSARSIFAEALLRDLGGAKFNAYSAGIEPRGEVNPITLKLLAQMGHATDGLSPKDVAGFQTAEAPKMDFVFTVCDHAANEECPTWAGQPISAHWGLADPVKAAGNEADRGNAFRIAYQTLCARLTGFVALPIAALDRLSLQREIDRLGSLDAEDIAEPAG